MKILLLGKNGQVGSELTKALAPLADVVEVGRSDCDMMDVLGLRQLIHTVQPGIIVNAAAYTAVDKAESQSSLAFGVNDRAVGILGQEAAILGALVLHYSTDYVFDGEKEGSYEEEDDPKPLNVYGKSKLAGEIALVKSGAKYLIFRTSWVMGISGENFLKTMLRLAVEKEEISVVKDQYGAPTSAALIAEVTAKALSQIIHNQNIFNLNGLYHLTASGVTNWYEYANYIINHKISSGVKLRLGLDNIKGIPSHHYKTIAKRPKNSVLNTQKIRKDFGVELPFWRVGVDQVLDNLN